MIVERSAAGMITVGARVRVSELGVELSGFGSSTGGNDGPGSAV